MEKRELIENFYVAFQLPMLIVNRGEEELVLGGNAEVLTKFHRLLQKKIRPNDHRITMVVTNYDMFAACLSIKRELKILVGPVHGSPIQEDKQRLFCGDLGIEREQRREVLEWLGSLPVIETGNFAAALSFLYFSLTGENAKVYYAKYRKDICETELDLSQVESEGTGLFDKTKEKLLECIERGDTEGLNNLLGGWYLLDEKRFPIFSENRMKSMQISLAAMILYAGQAAVRGGVAQEVVTAQSLLDYERLFSFKTSREFMQCFKEIAMEYAIKVRECRNINRESVLVRKIDHVIQEHLWQKLTPTLIAEELEMNLSYLCREFKKSTGKTIGEYINERKIGEAKRLLRTTDLSLVEIADTLGFSSQSYFHRVFKRLTGQTPMEYRER